MPKAMTWVLVADGQKARVFKVNGTGKDLVPALDREFIGNALSSQEIASDRQGRSHDSTGMGRHGMEHPTDPHRYEKRRFAREVIGALETERLKGAFERLVLVAPPQALGDLRAELSNGLKQAVTAEVNKDLTHFSPHDLTAQLAEAVKEPLS